MNIGIIVSHPFQFDGPFYQFVNKDKDNHLEVIFTDQKRISNIYDSELKISVDWGIDLFSGYLWSVVPKINWHGYIKTKLANSNYDLLIINGYNSKVLFYSALVAKRLGIPVALRLDTVPFNNKSILKKLIKYILFNIFDKVYDHYFAIGSLTKEYLLSLGIKTEKISFFSYVVDNNYFGKKSKLAMDEKETIRFKYKIPNDCKIILSVAKFNNREAPWDLINAFSKIESNQNCCLMLIGDGEKRKDLEELAKKYPNKLIIFTGYISYPDLPTYYGISDLFVHTSNNEPWGVSVQEALASGLPVITSNMVGSAVDLIDIGKNGFVYPIGDIDKLAEQILNVLDNMKKNKIKIINDNILEKWNYESTWENIIHISNKFSLNKNS